MGIIVQFSSIYPDNINKYWELGRLWTEETQVKWLDLFRQKERKKINNTKK